MTSDVQTIDPVHEREAAPFGLPSKLLAMWLFIASDAVTFGELWRQVIHLIPKQREIQPG